MVIYMYIYKLTRKNSTLKYGHLNYLIHPKGSAGGTHLEITKVKPGVQYTLWAHTKSSRRKVGKSTSGCIRTTLQCHNFALHTWYCLDLMKAINASRMNESKI